MKWFNGEVINGVSLEEAIAEAKQSFNKEITGSLEPGTNTTLFVIDEQLNNVMGFGAMVLCNMPFEDEQDTLICNLALQLMQGPYFTLLRGVRVVVLERKLKADDGSEITCLCDPTQTQKVLDFLSSIRQQWRARPALKIIK